MKLFTYGTLRQEEAQRAKLHGFTRDTSWAYPTIEPADDFVFGCIIDVDDIEQYDRYEGYRPGQPHRSLYFRLPVTDDIQTYVGNPGHCEAWEYDIEAVEDMLFDAALDPITCQACESNQLKRVLGADTIVCQECGHRCE